MRLVPIATTALIGLLLAACGNDGVASRNHAVAGVPDEQLPTPAGIPGSAVTGMPDAPGPGEVGPPVAGDPTLVALDENGDPLPVAGLLDDGVPIDPSAVPVTPPEQASDLIAGDWPSAQDAVAVIRDYYVAINARDYAQAFALWSDGGRATGQSPQQFANGFVRTNGVSAELLDGPDRHRAIRELILRYGTPSEGLGRGPSFRLRPVAATKPA